MKPTLGYFKLRGWAGPIRLLLAYLEVEYTEKFYQLPVPKTAADKKYENPKNDSTCTEADWNQEKNTLGLPYPNLPYLIEGNIRLTETKAILRHIARTRSPNLLGHTVDEKAKVNMLEDVFWDMWNLLCKACLDYNDKTLESFFDVAKTKLQLISKNMTEKWVAGSKITVADFLLYEILYHYERLNERLTEPFPILKAYMIRFQNVPQISKCLQSVQFTKGPCFSAKFKSRL